MNQRKEYMKEWHQKHKERRRQKNRDRIRSLREWLQDYKSTLQCEDCGFAHPAALDFHHDGDDKDDSVAGLVNRKCSKERILAEIKKCKVLCSNCHRIFHFEERTGH